jgi:hypothetical protein
MLPLQVPPPQQLMGALSQDDRTASVVRAWAAAAHLPPQRAVAGVLDQSTPPASPSPGGSTRRLPGRRRRLLRPEKHIWHDLYLEVLRAVPVVRAVLPPC